MWFLDECHRFTSIAEDALLKPTEEPPAHVFFIFATTNPEQLKTTFKRRCMTFHLEALTEKQVSLRLKTVCKKEKKKVPRELREQIARESLGSLGTALMILDKIIDLPPKKMAKAAEQAAEEHEQTIMLCRLLLNRGRWKEVRQVIAKLEGEPESLRRAVLGYFNSVLLHESGAKAANAYLVMDAMSENFFNTGRAGFTAACYECLHSNSG